MEVCADTIHKQLPTIDLNSAKELILKARKNKTTSFLKEFTRKEIEQLFISMCIALDIKNFDDEEDAYKDAEDGQFKAPDSTPVSTTVTKPLSDKDKGEENNVNVESVTMNEKNKEASRKICRAYRQKVCSFGKKGAGCPFSHPPKCKTFCEFGLQKFNEKGCDQTKCELLHPRLCLHAIKYNACLKRDCKYHHLRGVRRSPSSVKHPNFNGQSHKTHTQIQAHTTQQTQMQLQNTHPQTQIQAHNTQQSQVQVQNTQVDNMTSFLLAEVKRLMEGLENRVEERLGSLFPKPIQQPIHQAQIPQPHQVHQSHFFLPPPAMFQQSQSQ